MRNSECGIRKEKYRGWEVLDVENKGLDDIKEI